MVYTLPEAAKHHSQSHTTRLPSGPTVPLSPAARSTLCRAAAAAAADENVGMVMTSAAGSETGADECEGSLWGDANAAAEAAASNGATLCNWLCMCCC
jgi:hypothetical protein